MDSKLKGERLLILGWHGFEWIENWRKIEREWRIYKELWKRIKRIRKWDIKSLRLSIIPWFNLGRKEYIHK